MTITYEPISTTTLSAGTASVTFSAIPATYTDLVLVFNGTAASTQAIQLRFNGDTATNYSSTRLVGSGSGIASDNTATSTAMTVGNVYATQTANIIQIMNYTNATTFKTVLCRSNNAGAFVAATTGLWRKTPEAITTILIQPGGGATFSTGGVLTLYGIKAE
jgi:hypothetical protein